MHCEYLVAEALEVGGGGGVGGGVVTTMATKRCGDFSLAFPAQSTSSLTFYCSDPKPNLNHGGEAIIPRCIASVGKRIHAERVVGSRVPSPYLPRPFAFDDDEPSSILHISPWHGS